MKRCFLLLVTRWLAQAKQLAYLTAVCVVNDGHMVEVALLLLRLLRENVTVVSVASFNLTRSGEHKTLLCAGISLNFWHFLLIL